MKSRYAIGVFGIVISAPALCKDKAHKILYRNNDYEIGNIRSGPLVCIDDGRER